MPSVNVQGNKYEWISENLSVSFFTLELIKNGDVGVLSSAELDSNGRLLFQLGDRKSS